MGAEVRWVESQQLVVINVGQLNSVETTAPTTPEPEPAPEPSPEPAPADAGDGPVRMARIAVSEGNVSWRPGDDVDWSEASANIPLRQGAEIWLSRGGRAELQFDDGSVLRLGDNALATIHTMYSDSQGEFTEIRLNTGTASLRLTTALSKYQIDAPLASVTGAGPANFRVDATNGLRVVVRSGQVEVQGEAGNVTVGSDQFLRLANLSSSYRIQDVRGYDDWDRYCDQRDGIVLHRSQYLPSSIALVAGDLDSYGTWVRDPQYGYCWRPNGTGRDWAPYRDGHWVWVSPFGWTWCGNEPWGWAPYHYGTWFAGRDGWLWRPGPAQQCWSPAVVHFSSDRGNIGWSPLAPSEVRYPPTVDVRFKIGNWAISFSIGGAASYYPENSGYCAPRAWKNREINRTTNIYNITKVTNVTNVYVTNVFVPKNSRVVGGATVATTSEFGGRGRFNRGNQANADIFIRGRGFAPPTGGALRFAGPTSVRPTAASFSPTRILIKERPSDAIRNRTIIRAPLPPHIQSISRPIPSSRIIPTAPVAPPQRIIPNVPIRRGPGNRENTPQPPVTRPVPTQPVTPPRRPWDRNRVTPPVVPPTTNPPVVRPGRRNPPVVTPPVVSPPVVNPPVAPNTPPPTTIPNRRPRNPRGTNPRSVPPKGTDPTVVNPDPTAPVPTNPVINRPVRTRPVPPARRPTPPVRPPVVPPAQRGDPTNPADSGVKANPPGGGEILSPSNPRQRLPAPPRRGAPARRPAPKGKVDNKADNKTDNKSDNKNGG